MVRTTLSVLALTTITMGCTAVPNQSPVQRELSKKMYDHIMRYVPDYRVHTRGKALAACVAWPSEAGKPVFIDTLGATWVHQLSHSNFSANEMVQGALQNCEGQKSDGKFDCNCQLMDLAGTNKLAVPAYVVSADHPISSRPSTVPREKPKPRRPRAPRTVTADCESKTTGCRP